MEKALARSPGEKHEFQETYIEQYENSEIVELRPYENSSLKIRILACLIDQAIVVIPSLIFSACMTILSFYTLAFTPFHDDFITALVVGSSVASFISFHWLYFTICESSSQMGTFGMNILGIQVHKKGRRLNFFEANNRYWYWLFTSFFFGINILGLIGNDKKLFHDQLCDTDVVLES